MRLGLHGVAAPFQRLIGRVLQAMAHFALACIDDIIIFNRSWEDQRCVVISRRGGTDYINLGKCHIGRTQIKYLGYIVGQEQVWTQLDNV